MTKRSVLIACFGAILTACQAQPVAQTTLNRSKVVSTASKTTPIHKVKQVNSQQVANAIQKMGQVTIEFEADFTKQAVGSPTGYRADFLNAQRTVVASHTKNVAELQSSGGTITQSMPEGQNYVRITSLNAQGDIKTIEQAVTVVVGQTTPLTFNFTHFTINTKPSVSLVLSPSTGSVAPKIQETGQISTLATQISAAILSGRTVRFTLTLSGNPTTQVKMEYGDGQTETKAVSGNTVTFDHTYAGTTQNFNGTAIASNANEQTNQPFSLQFPTASGGGGTDTCTTTTTTGTDKDGGTSTQTCGGGTGGTTFSTLGWAIVANIPTGLQDSMVGAALNGKIELLASSNAMAHHTFNPSTNQLTQNANMPISNGVSEGFAVSSGGKIYTSGNPFNNPSPLGIYNGASWATGASWSHGAHQFRLASTVPLADGGFVVCGGGDHNLTPTNICQRYNPATSTWSAIASMPTARWGAQTAMLNGKMYVINGYGANGYVQKTEVLDLSNFTWSTAAAPNNRYIGRAVAFKGKIVLIGGNLNNQALNSVEIYDPATNTYTQAAPLAHARYNFVAEVVNDKIYVIGGSNQSGKVTSIEVATPN